MSAPVVGVLFGSAVPGSGAAGRYVVVRRAIGGGVDGVGRVEGGGALFQLGEALWIGLHSWRRGSSKQSRAGETQSDAFCR